MYTQARVAALVASAWLVAGCASSAARSGGPEPVVMVGDGVKSKAADKPSAAAKNDPADARREALEEASKYGILGVLGGGSGEGLTGLFGSEGGVEGGVVGGVLGGPVGVVGGSVGGFGGLGGIGIGGGGTGEGIGLSRLGTAGLGAGYGHGSSRPNERVKARLEAATITGPLTDDVVQRILADHRDDVQDCYLLESKRNHVRGRMMLSFTIDGTGRVDEVWVPESSFWSRELASCVAQVVGTFRFPAPAQGASVKVLLPVVF